MNPETLQNSASSWDELNSRKQTVIRLTLDANLTDPLGWNTNLVSYDSSFSKTLYKPWFFQAKEKIQRSGRFTLKNRKTKAKYFTDFLRKNN